MATAAKTANFKYGSGYGAGAGASGPARRLNLVPVGDFWHDALAQREAKLLALSTTAAKNGKTSTLSLEQLEKLRSRAFEILQREEELYQSESSRGKTKDKDEAYQRLLIRSGTFVDQISALALCVQRSPVHNITSIEQLLNMMMKKNKRQTLLTLDALRDLFVGDVLVTGSAEVSNTPSGLLPSSRKLRYFVDSAAIVAAASPEAAKALREDEATLALMAFEERLKNTYFDFVSAIETITHDNLVMLRTRAIGVSFALLLSKPELEAGVLAVMVNKLGDREGKVSSYATAKILHLLSPENHPAMKPIVCHAVTSFLARQKSQDLITQYNAVQMLSQILFKRNDAEDSVLAAHLSCVYLGLFKTYSKVELEATSKAPVAKAIVKEKAAVTGPKQRVGKKMRHRDRDKAGATGSGSSDAKNATAKPSTLPDPVVTHKFLAALLRGIARAFPYANDGGLSSCDKETVDSVFRLAHSQAVGVRVQSLALLRMLVFTARKSNTAEQKQNLNKSESATDVATLVDEDRFYRALYSLITEMMVGAVVIAGRAQISMFLHVLFKAMREDTSSSRCAAFLKRIFGLAMASPDVGFVISLLWVASRVLSEMPGLWAGFKYGETKAESAATIEAYDWKARDPRYAHAERASYYELNALVRHYHPSVGVYARALLACSPMGIPSGVDPLTTFTISRFLDKFMQKKSRSDSEKPAAKMPHSRHNERLGGGHLAEGRSHIDKNKKSPIELRVRETGTYVTAADFDGKSIAQVAPDELFYHAYYASTEGSRKKLLSLRESAKRGRKRGENSNEDGAAVSHTLFDSEADEDDIEEALLKSYPDRVGGALEDPDDDDEDSDSGDNSGNESENDVDDEKASASKNAVGAQDGDMQNLYEKMDGLVESEDGSEGEESIGDADDYNDFDDDSDEAGDGNDDDDDSDDDDDDDSYRGKNKSFQRGTGKNDKSANSKSKKAGGLGFQLSGSPFVSAQELAHLIESNEGLYASDDENVGDEGGNFSRHYKNKAKKNKNAASQGGRSKGDNFDDDDNDDGNNNRSNNRMAAGQKRKRGPAPTNSYSKNAAPRGRKQNTAPNKRPYSGGRQGFSQSKKSRRN